MKYSILRANPWLMSMEDTIITRFEWNPCLIPLKNVSCIGSISGNPRLKTMTWTLFRAFILCLNSNIYAIKFPLDVACDLVRGLLTHDPKVRGPTLRAPIRSFFLSFPFYFLFFTFFIYIYFLFHFIFYHLFF